MPEFRKGSRLFSARNSVLISLFFSGKLQLDFGSRQFRYLDPIFFSHNVGDKTREETPSKELALASGVSEWAVSSFFSLWRRVRLISAVGEAAAEFPADVFPLDENGPQTAITSSLRRSPRIQNLQVAFGAAAKDKRLLLLK